MGGKRRANRARRASPPFFGFICYALSDGHCPKFEAFLDASLDRIDDVTGDIVQFGRIEHPGKSGPGYMSRRSRSLRARDAKDTRDLERRLRKVGGDAAFLRTRESRRAIDGFSLRTADSPAIVFALRSLHACKYLATLTLPCRLFDGPEACQGFENLLCESLSERTLTKLFPWIASIASTEHEDAIRTYVAGLQAAVQERNWVDPVVDPVIVKGNGVPLWVTDPKGRRSVSPSEYRSFRDNRRAYKLFVDEQAREIWKEGEQVLIQYPDHYYAILAEALRETGSFAPEKLHSLRDHRRADQLFRKVRRAFDVGTAPDPRGRRWMLFKSDTTTPRSVRFRFAPDANASFLIILSR